MDLSSVWIMQIIVIYLLISGVFTLINGTLFYACGYTNFRQNTIHNDSLKPNI